MNGKYDLKTIFFKEEKVHRVTLKSHDNYTLRRGLRLKITQLFQEYWHKQTKKGDHVLGF